MQKKKIHWRKEIIFTKRCWGNWMPICSRIKLDLYLPPCTKTNSTWIKDLNLKPETLKLLEESTASALHDTGVKKNLLNTTPFAQELRPNK